MFSSVLTIMKVETSIFINGFLYFLKKLFFLKNILKSTSYSILKIKSGLGYVAFIYHFVWSAMKALILPGVFIFLTQFLLGEGGNPNPLTLVLMFYFVLRLISSLTLELNHQKFIMIKEMRMNAKAYTFAHLLKKEGFKFTGRTLSFLLIGNLIGMNMLTALLLSVMATMTSLIAEAMHLYGFEKKSFVLEEHNVVLIILYLMVFASGYGLYFLIPGFDGGGILLHPAFMAAVFLLGAASVVYITRFKGYTEVASRATSLEKMTKLQTAVKEARFADVKMNDKDFGEEYLDHDRYKEKEGYAFLNALFFDRHRKFFRKPVFVKTAIVVAAFLLIFGGNMLTEENILIELSSGLSTQYTLFIFIMYLLCNANRDTKAMFYNCDLSMMRYGFYRQPKALLKMFGLRLKRIILGNMIPTLGIIIGLLLVTYFSGAENYREILPVLLMIVSLALFFSIHYMFMYYIFQPYTSSMEVKSPIFSIINGLVYFASYMAMQIRTAAASFLPFIILFSLLYGAAAVVLVYRKAPQTFRVK
ncbi:hypothetical protein ACHAL6_01395 [Proteiniclasticum sp. C24MP]|uniref:hypothetical protein n=1 Tax=Proteiniclasticum sp. C24MP TaxID=3374101 RepID=UPI0037553D21